MIDRETYQAIQVGDIVVHVETGVKYVCVVQTHQYYTDSCFRKLFGKRTPIGPAVMLRARDIEIAK